MKNFAYILIVSLMMFYPVFVLAKHNYIDLQPSEEEVEFYLSLLDEIEESFNQAQQLENGTHQVQMAGSGGVLALIAYTLRQLQQVGPNDIRILDQGRQLEYFGDITNSDTLNRLKRLKLVLTDSDIILYSRDPEVRPIPSRYDLPRDTNGIIAQEKLRRLSLDALERNTYAFDHLDDGILIGPQQKYPVHITYEGLTQNDLIKIRAYGSEYQETIFGPVHRSYNLNAGSSNFVQKTTDALKASPKYLLSFPRTLSILAVGLGLTSLFFANDAEAAEDGQIEIAPVEITPEDFEQIQNDIDTTRDTLLSLL